MALPRNVIAALIKALSKKGAAGGHTLSRRSGRGLVEQSLFGNKTMRDRVAAGKYAARDQQRYGSDPEALLGRMIGGVEEGTQGFPRMNKALLQKLDSFLDEFESPTPETLRQLEEFMQTLVGKGKNPAPDNLERILMTWFKQLENFG